MFLEMYTTLNHGKIEIEDNLIAMIFASNNKNSHQKKVQNQKASQ